MLLTFCKGIEKGSFSRFGRPNYCERAPESHCVLRRPHAYAYARNGLAGFLAYFLLKSVVFLAYAFYARDREALQRAPQPLFLAHVVFGWRLRRRAPACARLARRMRRCARRRSRPCARIRSWLGGVRRSDGVRALLGGCCAHCLRGRVGTRGGTHAPVQRRRSRRSL